MDHKLKSIVLMVLFVTACSSIPPDPNATRADRGLKEQTIGGCQPSAQSPPKLLTGRAPVYPVNRLLAEEDGYAILEFDITPDGKAENFKKIESSHPKFYVHARVAVEEWRFSSAVQDGTPTRVRCRFRQEFRIPNKSRR